MQSPTLQCESEMPEHIFKAIERLMAEEGLHNLSMHKIAKEANISAGTIYIYFKSKDELLEKFAYHLFLRFDQVLKKAKNNSCSYFEQYQKMWWDVWSFFNDNPTFIINLNQYQSLPHFHQLCKNWEKEGYWANFCQEAIQADVLCDFPAHILFLLGLGSAIKLSANCHLLKKELSNEMLEDVIERTWRSIQK
ncbi:TetR family transcriptional regulator [Actinobacillus seminis]|uniref:TetR family transcriptional regulator n=2 Tax=Actinobacillus seminis TaxID=722 RepID=A0A380VGR0_9PAST|nr:TetR/AcrR family transcriptional regulator [Actinobacillus seminis]SUU38531.1 TetR family transcriptional regulator [Actinobacillus seminis]